MYPIYDQIGKARLADWHAQAERDAVARAVRRARLEQRLPSVAGRLLSGQLQSWWDTLRTPVGSTVSLILGWIARTRSNPPAPGPDPAPDRPTRSALFTDGLSACSTLSIPSAELDSIGR